LTCVDGRLQRKTCELGHVFIDGHCQRKCGTAFSPATWTTLHQSNCHYKCVDDVILLAQCPHTVSMYTDELGCQPDPCRPNYSSSAVVHPTERNKYVHCRWGFYVSMNSCGDAQIYLEKHGACVEDRCVNTTTRFVAVYQQFYLDCATHIPTQKQCTPQTYYFNEITERCVSNPCFSGRIGTFPVMGNNREYLVCTNDGYPKTHQCPPGLQFTGHECS
jgi:hypothetical protein